MVGSDGLGIVSSATAKRSPVRRSMIMAIPLLACAATMARANACSASYWSGSSMERTRSSPRTGAWYSWSPPGIWPPAGSMSSTSLPGLPSRSLLYSYSSPERPVPSVPTIPTRGPASCPAGSNRFGSCIVYTPGTTPSLTSLSTFAAVELGTVLAR